MHLTTKRIETILAALPGCKVGLIGDLFLDRYFDIDPALDEPSIETGLTAYQIVGIRCYPGALGTVLNNLLALGVGGVCLLSAIGDDGEGYALRQVLAQHTNVDTQRLLTVPGRFTPTYTKPMRLEASGLRELNRLDLKNRTPTPDAVQDQLCKALPDFWNHSDAIAVLDQVSEAECGVVTHQVREAIQDLAQCDGAKFVLADSRERIGLFRHVCLKPNEHEARKAVSESTADASSLAQRLAQQAGRAVFLTRGAAGMSLAIPSSATVLAVPAFPIAGPIDICGAGDSCTAGIISARIAGASAAEAAEFGQLIASITVQQLGITGTATPQQVYHRWQHLQSDTTSH
jgi:bifunctional ADP-heptose synthase (sugar kinase/adenylyltransferase)